MNNSTEVKALNPQDEALIKAKSLAEKTFELVVQEVNAVVAQCKSIKITDEGSLAMAEQVLSKANRAMKDADEKRKAFNKPADERIKFVNNLVKSKITNPLEEAVAFGKDQLRIWNDEQKKQAAADQEKNNKDYTYLKALEAQVKERIAACNTSVNCENLIESINAKWPVDAKFGNYLQEANQTKQNFITYLKTRKSALEGAAAGSSIESVVDAVKQQEAALSSQAELSTVIDERKDLVAASISTVKSNVRKVWKFEIVDEAKLPRQFLSQDDKKIREYLSAHKEEFNPAGEIKGGVRFYQDEAPVIK